MGGDLSFVTLFDDRGPLYPLKAFNLLCLAATWAHHVRDGSGIPLRVHVVRPRSTRLLDFLEGTGASLVVHENPHYLCNYSGTYNKLLALLDQKKTEARILLDNDAVFVRDVPDLIEPARRCIMADLADKERAPKEIVEIVREQLGLDTIHAAWEPWQYKYERLANGDPLREIECQYFNSGVVTSPLNSRLHWIWQRHATKISHHFKNRFPKQKQRGAFGSDQLPLSTAVLEHGRFEPLRPAFNYRVYQFLLGECTAEEIGIVHQVGLRRYEGDVFADGLSDPAGLIHHYYSEFMEAPIRRDALDRKAERVAAVAHVRTGLASCIEALGIADMSELGAVGGS